MTERRKKIMSEFGEKLKKVREIKNLSQKALADLLKISPTTIYNWEHGNGRPNVIHLYVLCKIFKVASDFFLGNLTK